MLGSKNFYQNFVIPEFKYLAGSFYYNLIVIFLIFLVSLLAIGFGQSLTNYLSQKMNDPFIKFVDLQIPFSADQFDPSRLNDSTLRDSFKYNKLEKIYFQYLNLKAKSGSNSNGHKSRMIKTNSEFFQYLTKESELLKTSSFKLKESFQDDKYSVILTEDLLNELGYRDKVPPYVKLNPPVGNPIPFTVAGIVAQLPNEVELLITEKLFNAWKEKESRLNTNRQVHDSYLRIYLPTDKTQAVPDDYKEKPGLSPAFGNGKVYEKNGVSAVSKELTEIKEITAGEFTRLYALNRAFSDETDYTPQVDQLAIPFRSLDSVQAFQGYLTENFRNIKLSMDAVESKRNFQIFNKVSYILSIILVVLSTFSVVLFIVNIITSHFESNKQNLGTLKAFGLSNSNISNIYTLIAGFMVLVAFGLSYIISAVAGKSVVLWVINLFDLQLSSSSVSFFSLPFWMLILFLLVLPVVIVYWRLNARIRNQTPGDLVYERV